MRALLAAGVVVVVTVAASGQVHLLWGRQKGTGAQDWVWALAPDGAGGVYATGDTLGNFGDPSAHLHLSRYNGVGNELWFIQFGRDCYDGVWAAAPDESSGVFVAGGTCTDDPNEWDCFLARYAPDGAEKWMVLFGAKNEASDSAGAATSDRLGGVFVGGETDGDFAGPSMGGTDAFVARFDEDGHQQWATQFGTDVGDSVSALARDGAGGVFAGGTQWFLGTGSFVSRLNESGKLLWVNHFGDDIYDNSVAAVAEDGTGGVYVAGDTFGYMGGWQHGEGDAYVGRFDSSGNTLWIVQFGTEWADMATALATDDAGGVYVAGVTGGELFGPPAGNGDLFVARIAQDGTLSWGLQFGTIQEEWWGPELCPDEVGGIFLAGETKGDLFGPNVGSDDYFVARFTPDCYPDCDESGVLDFFDFLCFTNRFNGVDPAADCTADGELDLFDFLCFVNAFNAGC